VPFEASRREYATLHGPTEGDRVRLADTSLVLEITADYAEYGDEVVSGWAKNHREGMMINPRPVGPSELDTVIVGAIVMDPVLGIFKGSIGIKDGRIVGIGNAGNPDIQDNVDLLIGPGTNVMGAGGLIATPGGIDSHVHFITPRLMPVALEGGVTTLIGAGLGHQPARNLQLPLIALEAYPLNIGLQARSSSHRIDAIDQYIAAGACGFKIHEDMGAYAPIIDATLTVADAMDVSVCLHTDGLNEAVEFSDTIDAMRGRTVHAYHVEGAGGGHTPDALMMATRDHIIASSTTPTVPYGVGAAPEHIDMMSVMHGQNYALEENVEAVRLRIRSASMAAEDLLHDMGAISIINSDSQGMGRIQETIRRTWQLADANKQRSMRTRKATTTTASCSTSPSTRSTRYHPWHRGLRGLPGARQDGGYRTVGSEVLRSEAEPGDQGRCQRLGAHWQRQRQRLGRAAGRLRRALGRRGRAPDWIAANFVAEAAIEGRVKDKLKSDRAFLPVRGARHLKKSDLVRNVAVPSLTIEPDSGYVWADGKRLECEPLEEVSLNRRYMLS
jgi:urease subunit alpha